MCTDDFEIPQVLIAGILPGFASFLESILVSWFNHFILRAKAGLVLAMGNVVDGRPASKRVSRNLKDTHWVASRGACERCVYYWWKVLGFSMTKLHSCGGGYPGECTSHRFATKVTFRQCSRGEKHCGRQPGSYPLRNHGYRRLKTSAAQN